MRRFLSSWPRALVVMALSILVGALSVVFVGYSESLASARAMALEHGYEIDPDQELTAQGAACGAAGFVGGFATDGSLSKTSVADLTGQKTRWPRSSTRCSCC